MLQEPKGALRALVVIANPAKLNALTAGAMLELTDAMRGLNADPLLRTVVLTGAGGKAFSGGVNVEDLGATTAATAREGITRLRRCIGAVRECPVPVIARVNGYCIGGALELAAACDLRIASTTAKFKLAFASAGRCGDPGGSYLLTRLLGASRAREMFLLDEPMSGEAALTAGLINRLVDDDGLDTECAALAAKLAAGPTAAFAAMKRNLNAAAVGALEETMAQEAMANAQISLSSHDATEAARAFMDRREPRFRGH